MSTPKHSSPLEPALSDIPKNLRIRLIESYEKLKRNHLEGRFETSGLAAGKFCEVCLRILQNKVFGQSTPLNRRIPNFADECRRLITSSSASAPESIRVVVPRALVFMYTMRNKRGIGHIGGDVDANSIDSATIARIADWVICELIRAFHGMAIEDAQALVDNLSIRNLPEIWEVAGAKRVLTPGLSSKEQTLLLLYSHPEEFLLAEDLCAWVEYSQLSMYRRNILHPLHKARLIEFDNENDVVYLSPLGSQEVETNIVGKPK